MKARLITFLVVVFLSGCGADEDSSTVDQATIPSSPTETHHVIGTLSTRAKSTSEGEYDIAAESTHTEVSPEGEVISFPAAPAPAPSTDYSLTPPDPDQLIGIQDYERNRYYSMWNSNDEWYRSAINHEARTIFSLIAYEIEHHYSDGLPEWSRFVTQSIPEWRGLYTMPAEGIYPLIEKGFLQYLSDAAPEFGDGVLFSAEAFQATVYPIEDQSNLGDSWLLEVAFEDYAFTSFFSVTEHSLTESIVRANVLPRMLIDVNVNVYVEFDLNRDGLKDILLETQTYFAGGLSGRIEVYSWNDGQPLLLGEASLPPVTTGYGEAGISTYAIGDFDGDGWEEIQVTYPRFYPFGCYWETTITTSWIGEQKFEEWKDENIPTTHDCDLAQVILADSLEARIPWLEKYIESSEYESASTDLRTWTQLQLAVSYAAQGKDDDAEAILASLSRQESEDPFLTAFRDAYQGTGPSPLDVCHALYQKAKDIGREAGTFGSDIDGYLAPELYPIQWEPYPPRVCPYWDLLLSDLGRRVVTGNLEVEQALAEQEMAVITQVDLDIDHDTDLEIIAVLDVGKPLLTVIDSVTEGWRINPIDFLFDAPVSLHANLYDANEDGTSDILILANLGVDPANTDDSFCLPGSEDYQLMLVSIELHHEYSAQDRIFACYPKPPFNIETQQGMKDFVMSVTSCQGCGVEYFDDPQGEYVPQWFVLEGFLSASHSDDNIINYLYEMRDRVVTDPDRETIIVEIEGLIEYLPVDEPAVEVLIPELMYLIGLIHELDGEESEALYTYFSLIESYPDSPWSWLAWSRITPTPSDVELP